MVAEVTREPEFYEHDFEDEGAAEKVQLRTMMFASPMETPPKVPESTQTVFYLNFTPEGKTQLAEIKALKKKIQDSQSLISVGVNLQVQKAIDQKKLVETNLDAVGNYTTLVTAAYLRQKAAWLNSVVQFTMTDELTVKSSSFHEDILKLALKDFIPLSAVGLVEKALTAIAKSIANSSSSSHKKGINYMIMTTHYVWDDTTKTVEPKQRVIQFQTSEATYQVTRHKTDYKESTVKMAFSMVQADFNEGMFDDIWAKVKGPTVDDAVKRVLDNTLEVEVPPA